MAETPHAGIAVIRSFLAESGMGSSIAEVRAVINGPAGANPAPDGVTVSVEELAGRPVEWLEPQGVGRDRVVLYLHGGGYCAGSLGSHRGIGGRLALEAKTAVVTLDYRLAPEDPFPAAVDDAVAAYRALLALGIAGSSIAIAGDSAGGGLTMSAVLALRGAGDPLPAALAVLSPWVDLTQTSDAYDRLSEADPLCSATGLTEMAGAYLGDADPKQELASPRFADLTGLPPLRIDVGTEEVLLDDATGLADAAAAAGVEASLVVWPQMIHVFQAFPGELVPESDQSIHDIGEFLSSHLR